MNINNVKYIMKVIETGSITEAAKLLYISQPALSQTIKQVEKYINAKIFYKKNNRLHLTESGKKFYDTYNKILLLEKNLIDEIKEYKDINKMEIRFGISTQLGTQYLPIIINSVKSTLPQISLMVEVKGSSELERMVYENKLDVAITSNNFNYELLNYDFINADTIGILSGEGTPIFDKYENGDLINIIDAKDCKFVSTSVGHRSREVQERLFAQYGINPEIVLEVDNFEIAKKVSIYCHAIMIAPYSLIRHDTDYILKNAHFYPLSNIETSAIYITNNKDRYLSNYHKKFIELVKKKISD